MPPKQEVLACYEYQKLFLGPKTETKPELEYYFDLSQLGLPLRNQTNPDLDCFGRSGRPPLPPIRSPSSFVILSAGSFFIAGGPVPITGLWVHSTYEIRLWAVLSWAVGHLFYFGPDQLSRRRTFYSNQKRPLSGKTFPEASFGQCWRHPNTYPVTSVTSKTFFSCRQFEVRFIVIKL